MCGKEYENGIIINGSFICEKCENNIVNEKVDSRDYEYFKEQIKERISEIVEER